jgi:HSP20 family protein
MLQLLDELTFGSPWRNFDRLHRELEGFCSPVFKRNLAPVNVYTRDDAAKVVVTLPGWKAEWFDLSVQGDKLTLSGETRFEDEKNENRSTVRLNRVVNLPFRVKEDGITATYKDGLLTVDLQRHEADKPRKIAINAA